MKRFSLFAANLAGTAVLADLVRYLQASTVTRLLILLIVIAIIAYFCWSGGKDEKSGCFYVFVGASLTIMDLLILTEHSSLMSYTAEIIVLFLTNAFVYWVLEGILTSSSDARQPPKTS